MITICVISTMLIMVRSTRTVHAELRLITVTTKYDGEARPALRKRLMAIFPSRTLLSAMLKEFAFPSVFNRVSFKCTHRHLNFSLREPRVFWINGT